MLLTPVEKRGLNFKGYDLDELLPLNEEMILEVALKMVAKAMAVIHSASKQPGLIDAETKPDGSPVTATDKACEDLIIKGMLRAFPGMGFNGEERGVTVSENGFEVVIDALDGTRAFISNEIHKVGVNLAVRHHQNLTMSVVGNPGTGEITYAWGEHPTRLLSLNPYGDEPFAQTLPDQQKFDDRGPRVMTRQQQGNPDIDPLLMKLWHDRELRELISPGGSPSVHLADAARGDYIYVHDWVRDSKLYDLTAKKLVENAGGKVIGLDGNTIELEGYKGLVLAGVDLEALEQLRKRINQLMPAIVYRNGS